MQYLLIHCFSPPSPHNLSFDVRALFIHCQSWFFDLFFICFKLNLQVFGARMFIPVIKYAYSVLLPFCLFIFEDNLKKGEQKRNHFRRCSITEKWFCMVQCAFNYDVKENGNLFWANNIFRSWFSDFQFAPITCPAHLLQSIRSPFRFSLRNFNQRPIISPYSAMIIDAMRDAFLSAADISTPIFRLVSFAFPYHFTLISYANG